MAKRKSSAEKKKLRKKEELKLQEKQRTKKVSKEAIAEKIVKKSRFDHIKLFGRWESVVTVNDPGLIPYINLEPKMLPKTSGVNQKHRFHKSKMHIVERMALHMLNSGHTGKRHRLTSGIFGGGYSVTMKAVEKAFEDVEKQTKKNPIEVFVRAIENAALREEVTSYQIGSVMARSAIITSPQRRVDKVLRYFAQGSYKKSFSSKTKVHQALAKEIIGAYNNSKESTAIAERERIENEAAGAR